MELKKLFTQESITIDVGEGDFAIPQFDFDPCSLAAYPSDFWTRLESKRCCEDDDESTSIDLIDVDAFNNATTKSFTSPSEFRGYIHANSANSGSSDLRVISIHQANSWRPLNITRAFLHTILESTSASPELFEIILCFFQRNKPVEEAFSSAPFFKRGAETIELAYTFKYAAQKNVDDERDPWSLRQTGIYQSYNLRTKQSTFICLHPTKEPPFQSRLRQHLTSPDECSRIRAHPLLLHNILFASYFPIWRDYMAYYENRILTLSNTAMAQHIEEPLAVNHRTLMTARYIENRFLPLRSIFPSSNQIFETIRHANNCLAKAQVLQEDQSSNMGYLLKNYTRQLEAYVQHTLFLQSRAARTAQTLTDTLSFKNSRYTLDLTMSSLDDSSTVRVITVMTMIYLPPTFAATVLGMNTFFEMEGKSKIVMSRQFWIWVVVAVPLTAITVFYWWIKTRRSLARRHHGLPYSV